MKRLTLISALLLAVLASVSHANQKLALLVGISDYEIEPLEGPYYDVVAMKNSLRKKMNFERNKITTLINEQATKANILSEIDKLYQVSEAGDDIFIYFSGHGTSSFDRKIRFPLPTTSGAFIPYDVFPKQSTDKSSPKLVVGRTDLLPRLKKLDQGNRNVFVVVDACYSGNTVRGRSVNSLFAQDVCGPSQSLGRV